MKHEQSDDNQSDTSGRQNAQPDTEGREAEMYLTIDIPSGKVSLGNRHNGLTKSVSRMRLGENKRITLQENNNRPKRDIIWIKK